MTTTQPLAPIHACPFCGAPGDREKRGDTVRCSKWADNGCPSEWLKLSAWNRRTPSVLPGAGRVPRTLTMADDCPKGYDSDGQYAFKAGWNACVGYVTGTRELTQDVQDALGPSSPPSSVQAEADIRGDICQIVSEMLDHYGEYGIYPTTRCYDKLEALVRKHIQAQGIVVATAVAESILRQLHEYGYDPTDEERPQLLGELSSLIKAVGEKP